MTDVLAPRLIPMDILDPLVALEACLCEELAGTWGGAPCFCGMVPGAISTWDGCGECQNGQCGQAWIRVVSVFPYQLFPEPFIDFKCLMPLAAEVEVGCLRCVPTNADGSALDEEQSQRTALIQMDDGFAMWRAVRCCAEQFEWALGVYTPLGPQGGCVGGAWSAFLAIN